MTISRKIFVGFILLFLFLGFFYCEAEEAKVENCCSYVNDYSISNRFARSIQRISGFNYFVKRIVRAQITDYLSEKYEGEFLLDLELYSAFDLWAGKFKKFDLQANKVNLDGIIITAFHLKNLCNLVYFDFRNDNLQLKAPLPMAFSARLSEEDINRTLQSEKFLQKMQKIKIKRFLEIDFVNPCSRLDNNRIFFTTDLNISCLVGKFSIPLKMYIEPVLENNKLKIFNFNIVNKKNNDILNFLGKWLCKQNIVLFDFGELQKNNDILKVKELTVKNGKIIAKGTYWLPKNHVF